MATLLVSHRHRILWRFEQGLRLLARDDAAVLGNFKSNAPKPHDASPESPTEDK
jgi:hypothetical protein